MEEIIYIAGQGLGIVAIALGFLSYQMHTQKQLLLMQTATAIVFCLHYLMIGAISGMALNIVNIFRNVVYYYRNQKGSNGKLIPILFAILLGVIGIFTWEAWYSIFVFLGLIINTLCMSFSDPQNVRKSILVTSPMVLIYDAFALSIGGMIYESVAIVSSVIGILRNKKNK
ncbi:MAG: YgjV family protein [Ruminococcaceae bacterium]|nr:YgjV family protein [Oscillospiraceae bacterium]